MSPPRNVGRAAPVCSGTSPSAWTSRTVSARPTVSTSGSVPSACPTAAGNVSCVAGRNESAAKWSPGEPRSAGSTNASWFSCWSACCSLRGSIANAASPPPPLPRSTGRETSRSVPTPVSGPKTSCWASSTPRESAVTATTSAIPTARPSAVTSARPRRRASSAPMKPSRNTFPSLAARLSDSVRSPLERNVLEASTTEPAPDAPAAALFSLELSRGPARHARLGPRVRRAGRAPGGLRVGRARGDPLADHRRGGQDRALRLRGTWRSSGPTRPA